MPPPDAPGAPLAPYSPAAPTAPDAVMAPGSAGMLVSGISTPPGANGFYSPTGAVKNGKPVYRIGVFEISVPVASPGRWAILRWESEPSSNEMLFESSNNTATPDLVSGWNDYIGTGDPVLVAATSAPSTPGTVAPVAPGNAPAAPGSSLGNSPGNAPAAPGSVTPTAPPAPDRPDDFVRYAAQSASEEAQAVARRNIGAAAAVAGSQGRYLGMVSSPPISGDHLVGDWIQTYSGDTWTCINSGNPGIWQTPNQDIDEDALMAPPSYYGGERVYPGPPSTPTVMTTGRAYAVTYPLSQRVAITHIRVGVTGVGYNGAKIRAGIYEDNYGTPKRRLAYGEVAVDVAVITAAKSSGMATMAIPLDVPVPGGRWIWIVLLATAGGGGEPVVQFMNSSPYYPSVGVGYPGLSYNGFALYKDGYTALPERFNRGNTPFGQVSNAVPRFSMAFAVPDTLPQREPDRHLAVGPTLEDEANCLQEPNVYYDASRDISERYVMTYTIRWGSPALAWATAPHPSGPWTKKGVFWEDSLGKSSLIFDNGVLYVYSCGASLTVRSGPNPGALGTESVCMTAAQLGAGNYQNTHVLKRGAGDYVLFVEANVAVIGWATGYATGTSPLGPFTMQVFPVTGLQRHPSSTYGGPCCNYTGGLYRMWIHSGEGGINPTEIYHCTSPDLVTWTGSENPIIRRESRWEVDQVADPHFFRDPVTGIGYLYWDALDNFMPRSVIMVSNPNVLTIDE